jgi:hypothetical protein
MIPDTVLRAFRKYMGATGLHLPPPKVLGAYDSRRGLRGAHDDLSLADFAPGGVHGEEANTGSPLDALRKIAGKLSEADWSEFQQLLCEEDEEDEAEVGEDQDQDQFVGGPDIENLMPKGRDGEELDLRGLRDDNIGVRGRETFTRQDLGKDRRRPAADARPKGRYLDNFDVTFPNVSRIGVA